MLMLRKMLVLRSPVLFVLEPDYEVLSELSTIDVKGKVTDEEFKVSREGLLLLRRRQSLIGENVPLFFYVEVVCNRDVADEARRGGGSEDGEGNGLGIEFEGEGEVGGKLRQVWRWRKEGI
ncbi:hypothetical protein DY000_02017117 [Brassica cretica]|uniref:Uncharacterized protein n=1 Tax=Brassica cretica TaxID=69181 RepID=A0ABQ7CSM3_BRACR|nr:hypothetical protein DY000_02017117 [Brassica cretica]